MSIFNYGWIPQIQQELRRFFASTAQGALAESAIQPAAIGSTVQAYDSDLNAIAGLTGTGGIERTGTGTAATYPLTAYGKSLIAAADASAGRGVLGVTIGANVQGWNTNLDGLGGVSTTGLVNRTGTGIFSTVAIGAGANAIPRNDSGSILSTNGGFSGPAFFLSTTGQSARFAVTKNGNQNVSSGDQLTGWSGTVVGSVFNTTTGVFTAPVDGFYELAGYATFRDLNLTGSAGIQIAELSIVVNSIRHYLHVYHNGAFGSGDSAGGGSRVFFMSAGQTAFLRATASRHGDSGFLTVLGNSGSNVFTHFSGHRTLHGN